MSTACRVLVVGSGVIGLRTSLELLRCNARVLLVSPVSPLAGANCSQGSGGLWMPFHCNDPRVNRWATETLDELYPQSKDPTNSLVESVACIALKDGTGGLSVLPSWSTDPRLEFQHMTVEMLERHNECFRLRIPSKHTMLENNYTHAFFWHSPTVDAPAMLTSMMQQIEMHPNTQHCSFETGHYYSSVDEMVKDACDMGCDALVNCTGLGAKKLCDDNDLIPARGILLYFDRATAVRTDDKKNPIVMTRDAVIFADEGAWGNELEPAYLIPRGDVLVVGGSVLKDDNREGMTAEERHRLLLNAKRFGIDVDATPPSGEWTGYRPFRPTTRCEVDKNVTDVKLVHSYGHGGSGFGVSSGVAKETVRLLGL